MSPHAGPGTTSPRQQERRRRGPVDAAVAALLAAGSALPYLAAGVSRSFISLDDPAYVVENPHVRGGLTLDGAGWALTAFHSANWHPLTWLSHMLDVSLFGMNATAHHLTSIALNSLVTALLFLAVRRMTGALWPSACAAALFGMHPLHVESVAWVAERKDVLAGLCFALVLLAYERSVRRRGDGRSPAVALLLALGLSAKPTLVTVPFLLLLLDAWPLGRLLPPGPRGAGRASLPWRGLLAEKAPLLALAVASGVLTLLAQNSDGGAITLAYISGWSRLSNALFAYLHYLRAAAWPTHLAVFYPHPILPRGAWETAGAALALAAATALVIRQLPRRPYLAAGWFWFLGLLLPVIGLVQVGLQAYADRYLYLPLFGLALMAAWSAAAFFGRRRGGALLAAATALALLPLGAAAARQAGYWRDGETLYRRALEVTSGNWFVHDALAGHLAGRGRAEEAIGHLREAARLHAPDGDGAALGGVLVLKARRHALLGSLLAQTGRAGEALEHGREAVRLAPGDATGHHSLGFALDRAGRAQEAIAAYREARRLGSDSGELHNNLGVALARLGLFEEALAEYRAALAGLPGNAGVHVNRGLSLCGLRRFEEAATAFREALRIQPGDPEARARLGVALLESGRIEEARDECREAVRRGPDNPLAAEALAAALAARTDLTRP